jgi:UDPglucose 6-dehydrogenase
LDAALVIISVSRAVMLVSGLTSAKGDFMASVTVVGTGYVGLIQGLCLAHSGHRVTCVDNDADKVASLNAGSPTIHEPGLRELLAEELASGRISFVHTSAGWDGLAGEIVFVAVGTPMAPNGAADLRAVRSVVQEMALHADRPFVLVMKSTVPPGTGRTLIDRHLTGLSTEVSYVSNPEFLREGRAIEDWYTTDRIVIGADDPKAAETVSALYANVEAPVLVTDIATAETIKYASNAFLSTKISFINEMANVCDSVGADIDAVATGIGMDRRIGSSFLKAGIGYGGSCFPKDTRALDFISTLSGYQFELLKAVIEVNNRQRLLPVMHLSEAIPDLAGRRVALLGLSFKPHTDDVRESPVFDIVPLLQDRGASVRGYDPQAVEVPLDEFERTSSVWEALEGASAAVLVTEWPEFLSLDWARVRQAMVEPAIVFDGRNALDRDALERAGLTYMAVGREGAHRRRR